jgi:KaiC/GvpD/RAD55 family RecA-like ATPase
MGVIMKKLKTGIFGMDRLIGNGIRPNTVSVVIGASGTGKSLLCLQYIRKGLAEGTKGIYISLEQKPKSLLEEACLIGWDDLQEYYEENKLMFFETTGADFKKFITEMLPGLAELSKGDMSTRIVIDPLTPLMWVFKDKKEQREILATTFTFLRKLGTTMIAVEQHSHKEFLDEDVSIPMFLADNGFHLRYFGMIDKYSRSFRILKLRGDSHGEDVYPLKISKGIGLTIIPTKPSGTEDVKKTQEHDNLFNTAESLIKTKLHGRLKEMLLKDIEILRSSWSMDESPIDLLNIILEDCEVGRIEVVSDHYF